MRGDDMTCTHIDFSYVALNEAVAYNNNITILLLIGFFFRPFVRSLRAHNLYTIPQRAGKGREIIYKTVIKNVLCCVDFTTLCAMLRRTCPKDRRRTS